MHAVGRRHVRRAGPARSSGSSANPAAARRRWRAASWACCRAMRRHHQRQILFEGRDLVTMRDAERRALLWREHQLRPQSVDERARPGLPRRRPDARGAGLRGGLEPPGGGGADRRAVRHGRPRSRGASANIRTSSPAACASARRSRMALALEPEPADRRRAGDRARRDRAAAGARHAEGPAGAAGRVGHPRHARHQRRRLCLRPRWW